MARKDIEGKKLREQEEQEAYTKKVLEEKLIIAKKELEIIDSFFKELSQNLREKDVSIKDFGTFKKIIQPARIARNPATGEPVEVPEKEVVKFKPSKNILNMKWL